MSEIKVIITADGSHSLLNEALDETYHSRHGAVQESEYVFIEKGVKFFIDSGQKESVSILEIGFGTGLNALLTANISEKKKINIGYSTLETFPLTEEIWSRLNYSTEKLLFNKLHSSAWNKWVEITSNFKLFKREESLQTANLGSQQFDLIYFDAFAPNKQPEMWEHAMLEKIEQSMKSGAVFVTYCAKGQLKRDLKSLGLVVESLSGPPGKREMVRAIKI
ncbi:MAG: tRNA (5-methylaminomethyl-2-thiouridine)(34)-methyltransferase MnmD [Cyclobacteriaceae bacterium]|nr:tRNA (5-methylaminomethyl-2-thiouridine)(34)-methyltransferase MnmD [Cyclobacteriaceae bacterium]